MRLLAMAIAGSVMFAASGCGPKEEPDPMANAPAPVKSDKPDPGLAGGPFGEMKGKAPGGGAKK